MKNIYGVKIIYKNYVIDKTSGQNKSIIYEEQILSVNATCPEEAYEKATKHAESCCDEYINPYNDIVKSEIYKITNCFIVYDDDDDVCELFSEYKINNIPIKNEDFERILSSHAAIEDLYILRYKEFNKIIAD